MSIEWSHELAEVLVANADEVLKIPELFMVESSGRLMARAVKEVIARTMRKIDGIIVPFVVEAKLRLAHYKEHDDALSPKRGEFALFGIPCYVHDVHRTEEQEPWEDSIYLITDFFGDTRTTEVRFTCPNPWT